MHHDERRAVVHFARACLVVREKADVRGVILQRGDDACGVRRRNDRERHAEPPRQLLHEIRHGARDSARLGIDASVHGVAAEEDGAQACRSARASSTGDCAATGADNRQASRLAVTSACGDYALIVASGRSGCAKFVSRASTFIDSAVSF